MKGGIESDLSVLLVEELARHPEVGFIPDKAAFVRPLYNLDVSDPNRYSFALPDKPQLIPGTEKSYHHLSIRRVLRNIATGYERINAWQRFMDALRSRASYSSDALVKNLRSDEQMSRIRSRCKEPFSLLAKLRTYDYDNPQEMMFVRTRPILIVPGAAMEDVNEILAWESNKTGYGMEVGLVPLVPLVRTKRINPEYFAAATAKETFIPV